MNAIMSKEAITECLEDIGREVIDAWTQAACDWSVTRCSIVTGLPPPVLYSWVWSDGPVSMYWLFKLWKWEEKAKPPREAEPAKAPFADVAAAVDFRRQDVLLGIEDLGVSIETAASLVGGIGSRPLTADQVDRLAAWYQVARHSEPPEQVFVDLNDLRRSEEVDQPSLEKYRKKVASRCAEAGVMLDSVPWVVLETSWERLGWLQLRRVEWILDLIASKKISRQHAIPDPIAYWLYREVLKKGVSPEWVTEFLGLQSVFELRLYHVPGLYCRMRAPRAPFSAKTGKAKRAKREELEAIEAKIWTEAPQKFLEDLSRVERLFKANR